MFFFPFNYVYNGFVSAISIFELEVLKIDNFETISVPPLAGITQSV